MKQKLFYSLGLILVSLLVMTPLALAEVVIIANNEVPVSELDQSTLQDVFLSKKSKWDDGSKIKVVMLKTGAAHETFAKEIIGKPPSLLSKVWKKAIFTGKGTPPKILKSADKLVEYIKENKGTIGYVDTSVGHDGVKTIAIK